MKLPQILLIVLYSVNLGVACALHGKLKEGTFNAWYSVTGFAIVMALLWWGGFFK